MIGKPLQQMEFGKYDRDRSIFSELYIRIACIESRLTEAQVIYSRTKYTFICIYVLLPGHEVARTSFIDFLFTLLQDRNV